MEISSPRPDRFIPQRSEMDVDFCNYLLTKENSTTSKGPLTPTMYKNLAKTMFENNEKILAFKQKAPVASGQNEMKVLYSSSTKKTTKAKPTRNINKNAEVLLDAPGLKDDFYQNILDWSSKNFIAIALQNEVYLWNGSDGSIQKLLSEELTNPITSVSWAKDGRHLAVGTEMNTVQLWDVERAKKVRTLHGHSGKVSSLAWNGAYLSTGGRDTQILNHDVRLPQHHVSTFAYHQNEICGMKWSNNGEQLACGGNDNVVSIWDQRLITEGRVEEPTFVLSSHKAAVKALSWAPFQNNLLATGGGSTDRSIKFWNTSTGAELDSIDTGSQVCALQWANNGSKELVSSHGFSKNQLTVWNYPSMSKISDDLVGHRSRVLHMCLSPDGTTVATAAGDESLRFWKVFEPVQVASKQAQSSSTNTRRKVQAPVNIR